MLISIDAHNLETNRTGVGRYLASLLFEWAKFDLPSDLKFILYFKNHIPKDIKNLSDERFAKKILKAPFNLSSELFFTQFLLPRAAKKDKADILFCPGYIAPIFYQGKIALALHDIIYEARPDLYNWPSLWDKIILKKLFKRAAQKAEKILVCSNFTKSEVLKHYSVSPEKIYRIYLASNLSSFCLPEGEARRISRECEDKSLPLTGTPFYKGRIILRLESEEIPRYARNDSLIKTKYHLRDKFILYLGSIFNRRHIPEAIEAFSKVTPQLPDYQFLIIGANHTKPFVNIDALINQTNRSLGREAIIWQKYAEEKDLSLLYQTTKLIIYLSDYEGFGLPIVEAMSCGAPVITTPFTSIPEVAGEAGLYVKNPTNISEISQAIYRGLTDNVLRQDLIKKGLSQAQKFSWEKTAKETLETLLN